MGVLPSEQIVAWDLAAFAGGVGRARDCTSCATASMHGAIPLLHAACWHDNSRGVTPSCCTNDADFRTEMADTIVRAGKRVDLDLSTVTQGPPLTATSTDSDARADSGARSTAPAPTAAVKAEHWPARWPTPLWPSSWTYISALSHNGKASHPEKRPEVLWDRPCVLIAVAAVPSRGLSAVSHSSQSSATTIGQWQQLPASFDVSATRVIELYPLSTSQTSHLANALLLCGLLPWFQHHNLPIRPTRILPLQPVVQVAYRESQASAPAHFVAGYIRPRACSVF